MKTLKQILYSMAAVAISVLGMTSCSSDIAPEEPMRQGEVDVVMTTSLPQEISSYASDGTGLTSSAEGGLKNLANKGYKVRFIMEVYPKGAAETDKPVVRMIKYNELDGSQACRETSFQTRLLAAEYDFVFWADIVKKCNPFYYESDACEGLNKEACYGNRYFLTNETDADENHALLFRPVQPGTSSAFVVGDLRTIKVSNSVGINTYNHDTPEMYDGYAKHEAIDLRVEPTTEEIVLKRPFAKLRLVTTDIDLLKDKSPNWNRTTITIEEDQLPNAYNALTGKSLTYQEGTVANKYWESGDQADYSGIYSNEPNENSEDVSAGKTLYVFYLPVPENGQNLKFNITVKDNSTPQGKVIAETKGLSVSPVPLYENKLTTIRGNLLSKNPTFNIRIDDEFTPDETIIENKEVSTVADLKAALNGEDQQFTFTSKVTKAEGFELDFTSETRAGVVYPEDNNVTLILGFASIEPGAVLTFKGSNAPKNLRIKTGTKCSLRIDLASSDVYYDGATYKYIVTNSGCAGRKDGLQYDVLFGAAPGDRFSPADKTTAHQFKINADFTLPADWKCVFASRHENKTCAFIETLQNWMNSNSDKTVWDFVGDTSN